MSRDNHSNGNAGYQLNQDLTNRESNETHQTYHNEQNRNNAPKKSRKLPVCEKFYKTRLCPYGNRCKKMSRCTYAHNESELKVSVSLNKTRLCDVYRCTGDCPRGDSCKFAHSTWELHSTVDMFKARPCLRDRCFDINCRHAHIREEITLTQKWVADGSIPVSNGSICHADYFRLLNEATLGGSDVDQTIALLQTNYNLIDNQPPPRGAESNGIIVSQKAVAHASPNRQISQKQQTMHNMMVNELTPTQFPADTTNYSKNSAAYAPTRLGSFGTLGGLVPVDNYTAPSLLRSSIDYGQRLSARNSIHARNRPHEYQYHSRILSGGSMEFCCDPEPLLHHQRSFGPTYPLASHGSMASPMSHLSDNLYKMNSFSDIAHRDHSYGGFPPSIKNAPKMSSFNHHRNSMEGLMHMNSTELFMGIQDTRSMSSLASVSADAASEYPLDNSTGSFQAAPVMNRYGSDLMNSHHTAQNIMTDGNIKSLGSIGCGTPFVPDSVNYTKDKQQHFF